MAGNYNFEVVRGDTFSEKLTYKDSAGNAIDTSGFSGKMQLKPQINADSATLELSDSNGSISFGGSDGKITLSASATDMQIEPRAYYYDLQITKGNGDIKTLLRGRFIVHHEVTT